MIFALFFSPVTEPKSKNKFFLKHLVYSVKKNEVGRISLLSGGVFNKTHQQIHFKDFPVWYS
jgi:hypothetical protein